MTWVVLYRANPTRPEWVAIFHDDSEAAASDYNVAIGAGKQAVVAFIAKNSTERIEPEDLEPFVPEEAATQ